MPVTIVVSLDLKPGIAGGYADHLASVLGETRAFRGCIHIHGYRDRARENRVVMIEEWESQEDYDAYIAWRTQSGAFDKLPAMLEEPMQVIALDRFA